MSAASATSRLRVGLDLHVLDGIYQGSRTHCFELFSRVLTQSPDIDYVLFADRVEALRESDPAFRLPHVTVVRMEPRPSPIRLLLQLPALVRRHSIDLLHMQYVTPPFAPCATAVTVHDILFESHPQFFSRAFVARSRLLVPRSIRRSAAVFTVSDFSRAHISERYSIPSSAVHTIPNGVSPERFFPGEAGSELITGLGLTPGAYFLTVGRLEPRKNHISLFEAWALLPRPRPRLVVVGQQHFGFQQALERLQALGLQDDILLLDSVTDAELPALYRHARGFVYASWAEGFGMPLLEAMASGTPVVTADNTALGEVGSGAALMVNPDDPQSIADAIVRLQGSGELCDQLVSLGLVRAASYDWNRSAAVVCEVYRALSRSLPRRRLGRDSA